MILEVILLILLLTTLYFLIHFLWRSYHLGYSPRTLPSSFEDSPFLGEPVKRRPRSCPLCGQDLQEGERVHSLVFGSTSVRKMEIYGCPWCYQRHPQASHFLGKDKRVCPTCKERLAQDDFVAATLIQEKDKKAQVKVLGCPRCYP